MIFKTLQISSRSVWARVVMLLLVGLISGCGGSGGGSTGAVSAPPAPAPPAPPGPPTGQPSVPYAQAEQLIAVIRLVTIGSSGQPGVEFTVADGTNNAIVDVTANDVRFIIAKLQPSSAGNLKGTWQSYINRIEQPGVGPGTEAKLQATTERGSTGSFVNNGDGSYGYLFNQDIVDLNAFDPAILAQAQSEGLDLSYDPTLTHRVSIQFDNSQAASNPSYDFQPATGAVDQILRALVVSTDSCNGCHEQLAFHGGNRIEVDYCVTCHNTGSTDANSGNTVAFSNMVHKIHAGRNLPSVQAGEPYVIWGFRDTPHDYSEVNYPQQPVNCTTCHAGSATEDGRSVATANGDNWTEYPAMEACGSCHDDLDFATHYGGQSDDDSCRSCHSLGGIAGSPQRTHADLVAEAAQAYRFDILSVANTAPGEQPVIDFQVVDPTNGDSPYDILNDEPFVQPGGASRLAVTIGWSTTDYTNTGNGSDEASTVSIDALAEATDLGNGVFQVISPIAIPDGLQEPFIAATGSGAVTLEGHPAQIIAGVLERIPVTTPLSYFSIDEANDVPVPRRQAADFERCADCHDSLVLHGENRKDNLQMCATCHNPRNTDRDVRAIALDPPTDGKDEEALDFKTMVHGIHASAERENALQIVGFRGFTTYRYTTEEVQYPGRLSNCAGCHAGQTFALPLAESVLGTTTDTGSDVQSPADDVVTSPATAVCASCHDDSVAAAHMESYGGDFSTSQALLDNGTTVEQCASCHGTGEFADVAVLHDVQEP